MHSLYTPTYSALRQLIRMRWIALSSVLIVLLVAVIGLHIDLPVILMMPAITSIVLANWIAQRQSQQRQPISDNTLFTHFGFDLLTLSWLLYCTGGTNNPFAALLLLPLTMAAVALPTQKLWLMAGLAGGLYSLLVFFNHPLPAPHGILKTLDEVLAESCNIGTGHDPSNSAPGSGFALHIAGMWVNFAVSVVIVCTFLAKQARTLHQRDQALHDLRERALRQERALSIGLMAAGAAHKLGSPLATLAVMISEAKHDALHGIHQHAQTLLTHDELHLMHQQVNRCKEILTEMVAAATPQKRPSLSASAWLAEWVDEWHVLRPNLARPRLRLTAPSTLVEPLIAPDRNIDQSLQGLLDNAADALIQQSKIRAASTITHEAPLEIELNWTSSDMTLDILDRGIGISPEMADLLGAHFIHSDKNQLLAAPKENKTDYPVGGLGIGFFLTHATLEQFGGTVELVPRDGGGTRTRVVLPLDRL